METETARAGEGWVGRLKAFRDTHGLKPLMCLVAYLILPVTVFQLVLLRYPMLDPARFNVATVRIIPTALLIVAVSFAQEKRPKGTTARLLLDGIYVALTLLWLFWLVGGSTVIHSSYGGYAFSVDVTPLVVLAVVAAGVNFAHDIMEYLCAGPWSVAPGAVARPVTGQGAISAVIWDD